ncbi:hypothetical protein [Bartonella tribocorum]|uniref:hypothetical protein n=1 Tax=Bartonella tribocorum TaxID=85701 RepID=UPI00031A8016|nr:hypothetical protein [Bartonella tribocorum]
MLSSLLRDGTGAWCAGDWCRDTGLVRGAVVRGLVRDGAGWCAWCGSWCCGMVCGVFRSYS